MAIILSILAIIVAVFSFIATWRLNKYIQKLEEAYDMQIDRVDNLEDTLRTAIKENYLKPNMTIQKPLIPNDNEEAPLS